MAGETTLTHETFLSPFSWRYGSDEMRAIWSEEHKHRLWRRVWVALATAQLQAGLVGPEQVADLVAHQDQLDLARIAQIEAEIHHDVMAGVHAYAEQCPLAGPIIHLGATSADIQDNADALRLRDGLDVLLKKLRVVLGDLADLIDGRAAQPCMGFTHLQPAEPTTVGYRLSIYATELLEDYHLLDRLRDDIRGKGIKGAVGTGASYVQLLSGTGMTAAELEDLVMAELDMEPFPVVTQIYPRKQDYQVLAALAGMAASLYRFAFDLRLLQSPPFGEWSEPFGAKQVGSSAMPFKRNPINAENMGSMARYVAAMVRVAWDNAAHTLLERTLDDSANRRVILPGTFLATDELLRRAHRILQGLQIHDEAIARNMATYGTFAATERLLMELVRLGADRQAMHEVIRQHSMAAWQAVQAGDPNPLADRLTTDPQILGYLSNGSIRELLDAGQHIGDAPLRARKVADMVRRLD